MRRDRGVTFVELTVVVAIIGVLATVISGGIVALLRADPVVTRSVGQSHDQQQLLNYLYEDVRSTDAVDVNTADELLGYTRDPVAPGCGAGGSLGRNVLQLTWRDGSGLQRSSYRLVDAAEGALLQWDHCALPGAGTWPAVTPAEMLVLTTNVADQLDPVPPGWANGGPPAHATVEGDVVTVVLSQNGREVRASATLRNDLGLLPVPLGTSPPPTTVVPTTSIVPEPTTTPTTTPAPGTPVLGGVCGLLAEITAILTVPTAPAAGLLREYGADGLAGMLSAPAAVNASVAVGIEIKLLDLSLSLEVCSTIHVGYNPAPGVNRLLPMRVTGVCTLKVWLVLVEVCLEASLALSATLPVATADLWTTGAHPIWLADAAGVAIPGTTGSVNVAVNPASVPPPPITVPTVGQGQPFNPLAAANGFSVMVEGDAALRGVTVNGAVAAGGNTTFSSATIAASSSASVAAPGDPSPLGLMVGGAIDLGATPATATAVANGFVHGASLPGAKVLTSGTATHIVPSAALTTSGTPRVSASGADQTNQAKYPVVRPQVFPFLNTFLSFDRSSSGSAALSPTNCPAGHPTSPAQPGLDFPEVYKQSGNWVLNLVPGSAGAPRVNVLNVTSKQLSSMTSVNGAGLPDTFTALVVNVTDHGNVTIAGPAWPQLVNGRAQSVLWNFPNANRVTISGTLRGSLLAPAALVTLSGATIHGDVVASTLTMASTNTVNVAHFDQQVPCIG